MIIDDERDFDAPIGIRREAPLPYVQVRDDKDSRFREFLNCFRKIKDKGAHFLFRNALIDHLWEM